MKGAQFVPFGVERPDWTVVRDVAPRLGDPHSIETILETAPAVSRRIARLVRGAKISRDDRLKRQPDGPELDLELARIVQLLAERGRTGPMPTNSCGFMMHRVWQT